MSKNCVKTSTPSLNGMQLVCLAIAAWFMTWGVGFAQPAPQIGSQASMFNQVKSWMGETHKVKVDEVEIISSEINDTRKETIKEAFLDGVVKIIIGTATIREGIDLQKRGTVIYNCYPEWNPTDIRQLEGRIWRQGNQFQYVRIVMPLVQDSMDVFVFQIR